MFSNLRKKWENAGFQRYLRNTGWLFFGRFVSLSISFFVGTLIARHMGPSTFGSFSYILSFVGLFSFIASLGIDSISQRELLRNSSKENEILGTSFILKLLGAFAAVLMISASSFFISHDETTMLLIFLFSLTLLPQAFNVIDIYFQSKVLSKYSVTSQIIANVVSAILKIVGIIMYAGVTWFISVYIIESFLVVLILLAVFKKYGKHPQQWKFKSSLALSLLKDSWLIMLSSAAVLIYLKIDQVILKFMLDDTAVGLYSAAVRFAEVWYFIPTLICTSLFPAIINAKKISEELFLVRMRRLYSFMFYFSLIISIPIYFLSPLLIQVIFGGDYSAAAGVLKIYMWASIPIFIWTTTWQYLIAQNQQKISVISSLCGAVLNVALNILLIPIYGINGAAIATVISYSIVPLGLMFSPVTRPHLLLIFKSFILYT
jgi:O-antigen/teichoic acid export membrane protein